jgi:hypothetical protein
LKLIRLIPVFVIPLILFGGSALAANGDCRLIRGASTPDTADDVQACRQDTWFHLNGSKVGNLAATGSQGHATFDTTKPTASVTTGAGGGHVANEFTQYGLGQDDPTHSAHFTGTFTGPIDNVAVELYMFTAQDQIFGEYGVLTTLIVDGTTLYQSDFVAGDVARMSSGGDAVQKINFAFTNVYNALQGNGLGGNGQHSVEVAVSPYFVGDDAIYVYDTSEVPSGMIFNLEPSGLGAYSEIQLEA